ncbi:hypothetical protein [Streptomyces sp. SCL15-4]|uniref:hypothetical protein n=1 Tax=Streptomyces sp. SCL15-4 TaxID=2967221 RepID=UPI00296734A8|nr:hypothetical protein [Streptomyces sp. SCL15-4]
MERTDQPEQQPTPPQPQPSRIIAEPATVQACQQDYAQAADVRERLGWKAHA